LLLNRRGALSHKGRGPSDGRRVIGARAATSKTTISLAHCARAIKIGRVSRRRFEAT
jgi:hypothetical protein